MLLLSGIVAVSGVWFWWAASNNDEIAFLSAHGSARWIRYPSPPKSRIRPAVELDARFLRSFTLEMIPSAATLSVRAFRRCEVSINGEPVLFENQNQTGWKRPKRADVAGHLRIGRNDIAVTVYNHRGPPSLWLEMQTGAETIETDALWEVSLAGAVWQPARLASRAIDPWGIRPEKPLPRTFGSLGPGSLMLILFAVMSALVVSAAGLLSRWLRVVRKVGANAIEKWCVTALILAVLALWCALSWNNMPSLERLDGFDAGGHLNYIQYILDHKRPPWPDEGWEMFQPPLFYGISAVVLKLAGLSIHSASALLVLRVQTLLFGLVHLLMVFLSLRLVFPNQPRRHLIGLTLASFLPMHLYMFQFVTNETLSAALVSASIYLTLRVLYQREDKVGAYAALGIVLGAAMLAKFSVLPVVAVVLIVLAGRLVIERRSIREWLRTLGVATFLCFVVCGWRFVSVWWRFGSPFVSNWGGDSRIGPLVWQDPGYQTTSYYLRFGRSIVIPHFSGLYSFADGIYSTLWGDALSSGRPELWVGPPWNQDLMMVGYLLALLPALAIVIGIAAALVLLIRKPSAPWFLLNGVAAAMLLAVLYLTLKVPSYAVVKAFYAMSAMVPLCAFGAWGFDLLIRRWRMVRWLAVVALGTWAINAYAAFWIPRDGAASHARLGRLWASKRGLEDLSEKHLRAALAADPHNANAQMGMAELLSNRGKTEDAIAQLRQFLSERSDYMDGHLKLAMLLALRGSPDDAIEHAKRAADLAPDHDRAWFVLGTLEAKVGHPAAAVKALRQSLRISPDFADAHHVLAKVLESQGKLDEATSHRRRGRLSTSENSSTPRSLRYLD